MSFVKNFKIRGISFLTKGDTLMNTLHAQLYSLSVEISDCQKAFQIRFNKSNHDKDLILAYFVKIKNFYLISSALILEEELKYNTALLKFHFFLRDEINSVSSMLK
jgi:hypothetical protein